MDRRGWQADRINRRRNLGGGRAQQANKKRGTTGVSHPVTQEAAEKGLKKEIEEYKSPEAKGGQANLRKADKKEANLRLSI